MNYTFSAFKNRSSQEILFIAGLTVVVLLLFSTVMYLNKLYAAKKLLQAERNAQELRIDSLLAVKLLVDKELAQTRAALFVVQEENKMLQRAMAEAKSKAATNPGEHKVSKVFQKKFDPYYFASTHRKGIYCVTGPKSYYRFSCTNLPEPEVIANLFTRHSL